MRCFRWLTHTLILVPGVMWPGLLPGQRLNLEFEQVRVPNSLVETYSAVEDDDGFIWFGRADGIYRYNGLTFTPFQNIPGDSTSVTYGRPLNVAKGSSRDIWIGSNTGGVSRLDLDTYQFHSYRHKAGDPNSLGGNITGAIFDEGDGIVWIGTDRFCLNRLDWKANRCTRYYPPDNTKDYRFSEYLGKIVQDPTNADILWIGAPFGVYRFRKSTTTWKLYPYTAYNLVYKPYPVSIYIQENGTVWAGSMEGIIRIDPRTDTIEKIPLNPRKYNIYPQKIWMVSSIHAYSENELLLVTHNDGIIVFNTDTHEQYLVNNDPSIVAGANFFLKDSKGNIWTVDINEILRVFPEHAPSKLISLEDLPGMNWIRSVLRIPGKNSIYAGTLSGYGLLRVDFNDLSVKAFPYKYDAFNERDVHMRDLEWYNDSTVLIASDGGLLKFDTNSDQFSRIINPLDPEGWSSVVTMSQDRNTILFCDEKEGTYLIEPEKGNTIIQSYPELSDVSDIVVYDHRAFLGTTSGIVRMNMQSGKLAPTLFPDLDIRSMTIQDTILWIGTNGQGLYRANLNEDSPQPEGIPSSFGSSTNLIYDVRVADDGVVWLNTDGGTMSYDPPEGNFVIYRELGIAKKSPIAILDNGYFAFGVHMAIRYFSPDEFSRRGIPPKPYITKIDIANFEENFTLSPDRIKSVELHPDEKELTIEFNAQNFNEVSSTDFFYRIHGLNEGWKNLKNQRYLNINNLDPGNYRLELKAVNAYGGESTTNKSLDIYVKPPVYQLLWFQALVFLFLFIFAYLLLVFVKRRRMKELHERTVRYFVNSRYGEDSVDEILWDLARNVISRLDFEDCVVYLYDDEKNCYIQKAAYGIKNPQGREILNPLAIPQGKGIVGAAGLSQQAVIVNDVAKDSRYIVDLEVRGSELAVPIVHQGKTIGIIDSEHSKRNYFNKSHAEVLTMIAQETSHKIAAAQAKEQIEEHEKELLGAQKEVAELKLTALQAQMNPHFIFNSLNSINWYILKNRPAEASIYLTKFSKLVRLILDNSKHLSVPVEEELKALRLYLELESMRFENTFDFEILMDEEIELEEIEIPPLILQPFVENAIWHGLMPKDSKGKLLIQIYLEGNSLKCIVQDNGIGRRAAGKIRAKKAFPHKSKGMQLTSDRIKLLHKNFLNDRMIHIIDLEDASGNPAGTRVEVMLPIGED